jgi:hypothetical protein
MPPGGWNVDAQSTNQIAAHYAEQRRHQNIIAQQTSGVVAPLLPLAAEGNLIANGEVRPPRSPAIIHEEILQRIAELEELTPKLPVGIGHNKPPEPIEVPPPLKVSEIRKINKEIRAVKVLPAVPKRPPASAKRAARIFKKYGEKVMAYLGKKVADYATAKAAEALWHQYGDQLIRLGKVILEWLTSLA